MSVAKNEKTGKWDCSIWYRDWQGKRKHTTKRGFDRKKDAEEYERKFLDKKQYKDITMEIAVDAFLAELNHLYELGQIKESTLENKTRIIKRYILSYFKDAKIESIKASHVNEWLAYLNTHATLRKRLGSRTLLIYRSNLNQIFEFCQRNYNIENNPVLLTSRPKPYSNDRRAKFWTVEQFWKCYSMIDEPVYKIIFTIIYWSGLRIGEVLALTPNDIKPDRICVNKNLMELKRRYKIDTPKNDTSIREVVIPNYLYTQIQNYISTQYSLKKDETIFAGINQHDAWNKLLKWLKRAGLPYISPHILRHSYASVLYSNSNDITVVASQIGHADINTTFKFYAHMMPSKDLEAVSKLEQTVILPQKDKT